MKKQTNLAVALLAITLLGGLSYVFRPAQAGTEGIGDWYSVLPPLIAIAAAFATGNVILSLGIAIVIGGLITAFSNAPLSFTACIAGIDTGAGYVAATLSSSFNLQLLTFTTLTLTMISVVVAAGGLHAVVNWLARFAKGPRSAQAVTFLMGLLLFIDDYANSMIVGNAMRTLTDTYQVSREKLAFLVDATSAPVAGMAIVSTWVGYEVGLFGETAQALGIDSTGYGMLFDALPYRFYCILMLIFVFCSVLTGRDFGPMRKAEMRARKGNIAAPDAIPMTSAALTVGSANEGARLHPISALLPIGFLIGFLLIGIALDGGGLRVVAENPGSLLRLTTWREIVSASSHTVKILAYGAGLALIISYGCARLVAGLTHGDVREAMVAGFRGSLLPIAILVCAWSLKEACDDLSTGTFLVALFGTGIPPLLFPAIVFVIAALTSFATGTSYGTMAILMPTAVPIAFALDGELYGLITVITLASILDGSIFGDHCSPVSDTTILSSIASNCDHMHHVRTQFPYSLLVGCIAVSLGYVPAAFGMPAFGAILAATLCIALVFAATRKLAH